MIPYMMMNLRYFTCHNIIFYSVQTLTFIKAVLHICTAIRQISLYILYLIHPIYNPFRTWAIFSKCSHLISTIIPYQYCKYMYIYIINIIIIRFLVGLPPILPYLHKTLIYYKKYIPSKPSQMVWTRIRPDLMSGLIWIQNIFAS